jgi:hypothetical protein
VKVVRTLAGAVLAAWAPVALAQDVSAELRALTERVERLERELAEQAARHREAEVLMQTTLERTAARLEQLLELLSNPAAPREPAAQAKAGPAPTSPAAAVPEVTAWRSPWWLAVVAVVSVGFAGVVVLRWRRARRRRAADPEYANSRGVPEPDPGVQEIWAAAALLGEAVGRLREQGNGSEGAAEDVESMLGGEMPLAPDAGRGVDPEDLVVLDDELLQPAGVADARAQAQARPEPELAPAVRPARVPAARTCVLRTQDPRRAMQSVLEILGGDPRVLQRPEPTIRCGADTLEVTFRVVPDLPPGERSHLEQRLRDACG